MTYSHTYVPKLEQLVKELENTDLETFISRYSKYECLIGPSESIKFLEEKDEEFERKIVNLFCSKTSKKFRNSRNHGTFKI